MGLTEVTVGVDAVTTVTVAVAVTDVSATEVAVMTTVLGEGTEVGAVYTPLVEPIAPIPVSVVESDQVTFWQVGFDVRLQPGLFTVAVKRNVSPVPTVALVGVITMLIPVTMVIVAVEIFDVSACAVPVTVTAGCTVVVPLLVVAGIVAGAVYKPDASIEPHVFAVTPVAQVMDQVTAVLLDPVTSAVNCWVRLVITLVAVGETVMETVDDLLEPQPRAPSAASVQST